MVGDGPQLIALPRAALRADGSASRYRIDVGLVPRWRGRLTRLAVILDATASQASQPVSIGGVQVGDPPGTAPKLNETLNLKEGMKVAGLKRMESKHGSIWWEPAAEQNGFDPEKMPRRALRMLEESWQVYVRKLGYRDPCLGGDRKNPVAQKINHITWYDGVWMGGNHFNVGASGLWDEGPGNPVPHEFGHVVQAAQVDFIGGFHWESHANYIRARRNLHFSEQTGGDCIDIGPLLRSNYFQDNPRLIYAEWRSYFYLDSDPDRLGLPSSGRLWQTGTLGDSFWVRLGNLLPPGVTRPEVAAGLARSWITFGFPEGPGMKERLFNDSARGQTNWYRYIAPLVPATGRPDAWAVPLAKAPMKFGWCFHELEVVKTPIQVNLTGIDLPGASEDWRWGFVELDAAGRATSSPVFKPGVGDFTPPADAAALYMFVVATPDDPTLTYPKPSPLTAVDRHPDHRRYVYELTVTGTRPKERRYPAPEVKGGAHANGGGFVAATAQVSASAYVGPGARVLDAARVTDRARILDDAVVRGQAVVSEDAVVSGAAVVQDAAVVSGQARIRGFALVKDQSVVRGRARVGDLAEMQDAQTIEDDAWVRGMPWLWGTARVGGHAILDADYSQNFSLKDGVHFHSIPWGDWYFGEVAEKLTMPRGLVAGYGFREADGGEALDEFGAQVAFVRGRPERIAGGGLKLRRTGEFVACDPSLTDAPAATWIVRASLADLSAQEFLVIKEPRVAGLSLGVDARGRPVAVLALPGVASVTLAATQAVVPGRPATIGLRLDGTTARLFVDGRPVAAEPCAIRPMDWFHDVTNGARSEKTTAITLGRSLSIGVSRFDLLGFRAFNIALSDAEMALLAPGNADLAGGR